MSAIANNSESNFEILPKVAANGERDGELLEVAMGPHHPSTHGVFRMDVVLDGEHVVKLKPVFGYLHRNHEKIAENTTYLASMPYTDRLDYRDMLRARKQVLQRVLDAIAQRIGPEIQS